MSRPASRASSSRGRTPAEKTSSAVSITSSLLSVTRSPSAPPIGGDLLDRGGTSADSDVDAQRAHRAHQVLAAGLVDL